MSKYSTVIRKDDSGGISAAVKLLSAGEIVAIPTETVYGLAANALNPAAIGKIFTAKGRPRDNPLIVHLTDLKMVREIGLDVTRLAEKLAEKFWPGPLTMIFRKTDIAFPLDIDESENAMTAAKPLSAAIDGERSHGTCFHDYKTRYKTIPGEVSCGLDTVAVRVPGNTVMLEIIKRCNFPLAAPSANVSGSPSPTKAEHVFADLNGKIPLIIDGGDCEYGVESTVVAFDVDKIRILRPGAVTKEQLEKFAEVIIDGAVYNKTNGEKPVSPGTLHRHYSPKAEVIAVIADGEESFRNYVKANGRDGDFTLSFSDYGDEGASLLFAKLRELDGQGAERIFARLPEPEGIGLAVYNRLIRAADFNVVKAI